MSEPQVGYLEHADQVAYAKALENSLHEIYWLIEQGNERGAQRMISVILGEDRVEIPPVGTPENPNARF